MRVTLVLLLFVIAMLVTILTILVCRAHQQKTSMNKVERKEKTADRLNEKYALIRTHFTFPKHGVCIPANAYLLTKAVAGNNTEIPQVLPTAYSAHYITDDKLLVPYGTQCNLAIEHTQLFLNAGSELVMEEKSRHADHFYFTGEVNVKTDPSGGCNISTGDWQIEVKPGSMVNIMSYENEPSI